MAKANKGVQTNEEIHNPPRPALPKAAWNLQVCPGTEAGCEHCLQGTARPATSGDRSVSYLDPAPRSPWPRLAAGVSKPSHKAVITVPGLGDTLRVAKSTGSEGGRAQGHQQHKTVAQDGAQEQGSASPCGGCSPWPLGSPSLNIEHRLGGQTQDNRGGPSPLWGRGSLDLPVRAPGSSAGPGPRPRAPGVSCGLDRHGSRELQRNVQFTPNATNHAKKVKSYWEGCWDICSFLYFLLYWPVQKFLVRVQMATTTRKHTVSAKRDESEHSVHVHSPDAHGD